MRFLNFRPVRNTVSPSGIAHAALSGLMSVFLSVMTPFSAGSNEFGVTLGLHEARKVGVVLHFEQDILEASGDVLNDDGLG
jgi:hypothetical protein